MKKCGKCGENKAYGDFYANKSGKRGVHSVCKACTKKKRKERYQLPGVKERINTHQRAYNKGNLELRAKFKAYQRKRTADMRDRLFGFLGRSCLFCGDKHQRALTIDHINGDGKQHRSRVRGGICGIYRDILTDPNAREKYQTLCMKCNWLRTFESDEEIIARYGNKR